MPGSPGRLPAPELSIAPGPGMSSRASSPPVRSGTASSQACWLLPCSAVVMVAVRMDTPGVSGPAKRAAPLDSASAAPPSSGVETTLDRQQVLERHIDLQGQGCLAHPRVQGRAVGSCARGRRGISPRDSPERSVEPHLWRSRWHRRWRLHRGHACERHGQPEQHGGQHGTSHAQLLTFTMTTSEWLKRRPSSAGEGKMALNSQLACGAMVSSYRPDA